MEEKEKTIKEPVQEENEKESSAQNTEVNDDTDSAADMQGTSEEPPQAEDEKNVSASEDGKTEKEGQQQENTSRGGFFGRKKKDKKDEQIEELKDRVTRQMAEFDNYRKRTDKEKAAMFEVGARSVIEKILPVVDNFERGLAGVGEDNEDPFVVGMQKTYKQLMTTLETLEVKPIEAEGQPFNPDFHNAVLHVDDETVGENIVVAELQKGYMYRDSVVRHSMVKVAN